MGEEAEEEERLEDAASVCESFPATICETEMSSTSMWCKPSVCTAELSETEEDEDGREEEGDSVSLAALASRYGSNTCRITCIVLEPSNRDTRCR